jgi:hypothetical protein
LLLEVLMARTVTWSPPAIQLSIFQPPRPSLSWEAMPLEHRQQVEHLLARMIREHALRHVGKPPVGEPRDE